MTLPAFYKWKWNRLNVGPLKKTWFCFAAVAQQLEGPEAVAAWNRRGDSSVLLAFLLHADESSAVHRGACIYEYVTMFITNCYV